MKVNPILDPLDGESVVGVDPPLKPNFEADWRRRLNLYTGRSLSDTALTIEQEGRAGRLATRGQTVSPGVVSGLEVEFEKAAHTPAAEDTRTEVFFYKINSGFGIAASGEDVMVPRKLQVDVADTRVYSTAAILRPPAPITDGAPIEGVPDSLILPRDETTDRLILPGELPPFHGTLEARMLGPRLRDLSVEAQAALPRVGILVLQPIVAEVAGEMDDTDPCEQDPRNYAFDDWELVDGARLILYPWPTEWTPLPAPDSRWRNRLVYSIFAEEARLAVDELLPWEELGVPIGLVAFDNGLQPVFVDRYSVVRAGGKPRRRTSLLDFGGTVFMWQARLQQFAEHLPEEFANHLAEDQAKFIAEHGSGQVAEHLADPGVMGKLLGEVAQQFHYLPPAGLLPRAAVEFIFSDLPNVDPLARDHFFPSSYKIEAAPVPMEQLDVAVEASAGLAPLDTFTGDQVQLLVPVPEIWYEPRLLKKEPVDERFQQAIDTFTLRQTELLHRRKIVRVKEKLIRKGITGKEPVYADPDPDGAMTLDPPEEEFGISLDPITLILEVSAITDLKARLRGQGTFMSREVDENFDRLGLEAFIGYLDAKVSRANDKIDFGFLNTQTNIYRIRQQMLGNSAGTRLATSPALASIATGESALASRENLQAFSAQVKPSTPKTPLVEARVAAVEEVSISSRSVSGSGSRAMLFAAAPRLVASKAVAADLTLAATRATTSQLLTAAAGGVTELFKAPAVSKKHVIEQSPIIGEFIDFRTVTIAARLDEPQSAESRRFAVSGKHQVVLDLIDLDLNLDDLDVPGVVVDPKVKGSPNVTFGMIRLSANRSRILQEILNGAHDPVPENADEGAYFSVGVRALDHTIGILRKIEGRVQAYRIAIEICRAALSDLRELLTKVAARLQALEDGLAEARHDLAVANALLVEEQARVKAINDRRKLIIEKHCTFLAYRRPRTADLLTDVPVRSLDPGLTVAPVPICLSQDVAVPPDLRATVELLRQVPVKWLIYIHPLLDKLDRVDILQETVHTSVARAQLQVQTTTASRGLYSKGIDAALTAQHATVARQRVQIANFDLGEAFEKNWKVIRERAGDAVSVASLIEASHGRSDVVAQATRELNNIARIAACLYQMFGDVLPAIRLDWAERLSQYDAPVNLRNLSSLPHWGEKRSDGEDVIPFLDRRQMQMLADWLYGRVDPLQAEAVSLIDDLVRICILLASHAPVNQIISGHVPKPTTVTKGGRVELAAVDLTRVRVGMHVLMYTGPEVVARGVVDDLSPAHVTAQVVYTATASVSLAANARVDFGDPDSFDRAAIKMLKR